MSTEPYRIMFVCTGNTCRSPMAEGALRVLLSSKLPEGAVEVLSSGTSAAIGYPATMYAIEASKIWNADISKHESQPLTESLIEKSDLILTMTASHLKKVREFSHAESKSYLLKNFPERDPVGDEVEDPIGQELARYNETFLEIGECLGQHLDEIVRRIEEKRNAS